MPTHDHHEKPFDDGTKDKLELFRSYLREWLPVFINSSYIDTLQVVDFFAGPGMDLNGNAGSPVITCEEIGSALSLTKGTYPKIKVYFNELAKDKYNQLCSVAKQYESTLPEVQFSTSNNDFHEAFLTWEPFMDTRCANLLFLDQNGVQQITESIFRKIVQLPHTDFIFFLSSAMVNRFKYIPEIRKYVPIMDGDLSKMNGTNVHRILTNAYNRWIPEGIEFYLGSFSIKKGPNVYGLVFGSGHPLGINKFLRVAWKLGGDANFDIDNDCIDPDQPSLFSEFNKPTKIAAFEKDLQSAILERRLLTNKDIHIFALRNGVLPKHADNALKQMMENGIIPKQKLHVTYEAWKKPNCEEILIK